MALSNLNLPGTFGPSELSSLAAAYDAALSDVRDGDRLHSGLSARDVRRRVAVAIIGAANTGVLDTERLKAAALELLARSAPSFDAGYAR